MTALDSPPRWDLTPIFGALDDRGFTNAVEGIYAEVGRLAALYDEHDIRGANGVGIDSCFVMGGIHAEQFPADATPAEREARLADLSQRFAARPHWVVPRLVW